jgi:signal transduction histidine kinase
MAAAGGDSAVRIADTGVMARRSASPLRRVLTAPFSRRSWAGLWYLMVSLPLAVAGFVFTVTTVVHPLLAAVSAPGVRKFADISRGLARGLLGEDVPAPPAAGNDRADGGARLRGWWKSAARDAAVWRARGYLVLKLPLTAVGLVVAWGCWLSGVQLIIAPLVWALARNAAPVGHAEQMTCVPGGQCTAGPSPTGGSISVTHQFIISFGGVGSWNVAHPLALVPLGAALLLAAPWLTHAVTSADRSLMRRLLGPASLEERMRALQETRSRAVDDSAARLRGIERDLHDGTQAQLVALAMKLGLAQEKLAAANPDDTARAAQLLDDAHRGAIEAIADLRTLARGIHPPVLDNGLADALATLASRSTLPVELVTDIGERPSAAIETIGYFSAAELLTNAAKHSGARHASVEAVHVPGLLRIRVTDDGHGGARAVAGGGLHGLADRVRTVDGRLDISSPPGGPTVVTVELPSRA